MIVPEYFKDSELACQCGCGAMPDPRAVELLYALRIVLGGPVTVTSAARCYTHNYAVGGKEDSYHTRGLAFDLVFPRLASIVELAPLVGFRGIGVAENFVHIDTRKSPAYWRY